MITCTEESLLYCSPCYLPMPVHLRTSLMGEEWGNQVLISPMAGPIALSLCSPAK